MKILVDHLPIQEWFDALKHEVDLWITDPPYPFNNQNGTGRFDFKEGVDYMYDRLTWKDLGDIYSKMYISSSEGARAYVFCNRDGIETTKVLLEEAGWTFRNLLIWDKIRLGGGYHWRNSAEFIVYASRGKPKVYVSGMNNFFHYKKPTKSCAIPGILYDPTSCQSAKPKEIWEDIIRHGGVEGDVCADPFSGSNPMRAALLTNEDLLNKIEIAYTNEF